MNLQLHYVFGKRIILRFVKDEGGTGTCMQVSHVHVATVTTYSRQSFYFHGPCEILYLTETRNPGNKNITTSYVLKLVHERECAL